LKNKNNILLFIFFIAFAGLYFSKTALSIFPYLLIIYGLSQKNSIQRLKGIIHNKSIMSIMLIFFVYLLSGINSENTSKWLEKLNTNLIYIAIPLGVYLSGNYTKSTLNRIISLFVVINTLLNIFLLINYILHFEIVNQQYLRGQTIYTPIMHVRYSYFVALSIIFSSYLFIINLKTKFKYFWGIITIFLIIFLHILAVRTGILSIYITLFTMGIYFALKFRKHKELITGLIVFFLIITISFFTFPSIKNKIKYSLWDIKSTINHTARYHTSDRIRIYSIINGIKLVNENPVFGTGIGDIYTEMDKKYNINYPDLPKEYRFGPIDQFLFTMASMGITGFILLYGLLLLPIYFSKYKHKLLIPFYILTFATFLGENTIELIVGKTAFLVFLSLFLCNKPER